MNSLKSRFKKFSFEFLLFREQFRELLRIYKLLDLAKKQIRKTYTINGKREGTVEEFRYRSIIYTLFYANFLSVSLITQQEKLEYGVGYVDTKLILRAIMERYITQKYILTEPQRLADLFIYWGSIENQKFQAAYEELQQSDLSNLALDMDFEGAINEWTTEKEQEHQDAIFKWEELVQPKQQASKARTWSGHSIAEMAKIAGVEDLYKLTFRETSWYTHGLITVADFFLRQTDNELSYSNSVSNLQKLECYSQIGQVFTQSFICADEALSWGVSKKIHEIVKADDSPHSWIWGFIRIFN